MITLSLSFSILQNPLYWLFLSIYFLPMRGSATLFKHRAYLCPTVPVSGCHCDHVLMVSSTHIETQAEENLFSISQTAVCKSTPLALELHCVYTTGGQVLTLP